MKDSTFLVGAATAGHQVEGNNVNSDIWAMEQMKYGGYAEKSGDAADHYNRYEQDILLMKKAGLNAYRFSLEWARLEPEEGHFDQKETEHYRKMIRFCKEQGIEPIVTLFHFASPKWLMRKGGWEADETVECFANYVRYVAEAFKDLLHYVCTINEANLGVLIAGYIRAAMEQHAKEQGNSLQVGMDLEALAAESKAKSEENMAVFGVEEPAVFPSPRSVHGNEVIMAAHRKAVQILHETVPGVKTGLSLSLNDFQWKEGGRERADAEWQEKFLQYLPSLAEDDFFGLQNYTRTVYDADGECRPEEGAELTQMGYEYYPEGLEHVLRRVAESFDREIIVTENGIATDDDTRRVAFIRTAMEGVQKCVNDGIKVKGYLHWSLMDNYEWQSGYGMHFGLIGIDRTTQERIVHPSLEVLGSYTKG